MKKKIELLNQFLKMELSDWQDAEIEYEIADTHNEYLYFMVEIKLRGNVAMFRCRVKEDVEIEMLENTYTAIRNYDYTIRNFWIIVAPQLF